VARIAGVNIPQKKRLVIALTYIYGIGNATAEKICKEASLDPSKRVESLVESELINLRKIVESNYKLESDLRREVNLNIKLKQDMECYEGLRHSAKMPVRGQNTRTNARTKRGKRSAPVSSRKEAGKKGK
jgi:small subunit ribosomal protein S13